MTDPLRQALREALSNEAMLAVLEARRAVMRRRLESRNPEEASTVEQMLADADAGLDAMRQVLLAVLASSGTLSDDKHAFDNGSGMTEVMTVPEMITEIQRLGRRCEELASGTTARETCSACGDELTLQCVSCSAERVLRINDVVNAPEAQPCPYCMDTGEGAGSSRCPVCSLAALPSSPPAAPPATPDTVLLMRQFNELSAPRRAETPTLEPPSRGLHGELLPTTYAAVAPPDGCAEITQTAEPLTDAEREELDGLLADVMLPTFTPRERFIARKAARAAYRHGKAAPSPAPPAWPRLPDDMTADELDALKRGLDDMRAGRIVPLPEPVPEGPRDAAPPQATCASCEFHNPSGPLCRRGVGRPNSIWPGLRVDMNTFNCNQWRGASDGRGEGS